MTAPMLFVPPLTPFHGDGTVDVERLAASVEYAVVDCGATHVVAAGVEAQEYAWLGERERLDLVDRTIELVDGRLPVVVGVSYPSVRKAAEAARLAEARGAFAVQALVPRSVTGTIPSEAESLGYFEELVGATSLPVVAYLNTGPGRDVSVDLALRIAALPGVDFMKESSRDMSRVGWLTEELRTSGACAYLTTMQLTLISLQLGAAGVTAPAPAAKLVRGVMDAWGRDDLAEAIRLQRQLSVWPARWMRYGLTNVMKASHAALGLDLGPVIGTDPGIGAEDSYELRSHVKQAAARRSDEEC